MFDFDEKKKSNSPSCALKLVPNDIGIPLSEGAGGSRTDRTGSTVLSMVTDDTHVRIYSTVLFFYV